MTTTLMSIKYYLREEGQKGAADNRVMVTFRPSAHENAEELKKVCAWTITNQD